METGPDEVRDTGALCTVGLTEREETGHGGNVKHMSLLRFHKKSLRGKL